MAGPSRYEIPDRHAEGENRYYDGMGGAGASYEHVLNHLGQLDLSGALDIGGGNSQPKLPTYKQPPAAEGITDAVLENLQGLA